MWVRNKTFNRYLDFDALFYEGKYSPLKGDSEATITTDIHRRNAFIP